MHRDGFNLYKGGGNIALANLAYGCLRSLLSPDHFWELLRRFQRMMRERTARSYRDFWEYMAARYREADRVVRDVLEFLLIAEGKLGYEHLRNFREHPLDVALTGLEKTVSHWRDKTEEELVVIHDESSNLARQRWVWDALSSPNLPEVEVGYDTRRIRFPLRVKETLFERSDNHAQLQCVDIVAGATAALLRNRALGKDDLPFAAELEGTGILQFVFGTVWPTEAVTPEELGTTGEDAIDPLEFVEEVGRRARRGRTPGP